MSRKRHIRVYISVMLTLFIIVGVAIGLSLKNTKDLTDIINDSVTAYLVSVATASRELLDVNAFMEYDNYDDIIANKEEYEHTLNNLRSLQERVGAMYIYALKEIDGEFFFIFDTDPVSAEICGVYELCEVHIKAFEGKEAADLHGVIDKWGSFNTGAVPIWKDGKVVGVIAVDFEDEFISNTKKTSFANALYLIVSMILLFCCSMGVALLLVKKNNDAQEALFKMANYDAVTGLPNRNYLMRHLKELVSLDNDYEFAVFFVDLDNFKRINDSEGHDIGDKVLKNIGELLDNKQNIPGLRKPSNERLNVSARIGGDEFVQIIHSISSVEEAETAATYLLENFKDNSLVKEYAVRYGLGLSVGAAVYGLHSYDCDALLRYADIAMYDAKRKGKNDCSVYNELMNNDDLSIL